MCSFVCLSLLGRGETKFDDAKTTFVIALPYFLNLMPPAFNSNLALWTGVCLNFAVYSSLLLLKKSFYAFFWTAVYLDFIPLVHYTTDKRLGGVYLQLPLQDPAFIWGLALNWQNTVLK